MTRYLGKSTAENAFLVTLKLLAKQIMAFYNDQPNDLTIVNKQIKVQRNILTNLIWSCKYPKNCIHAEGIKCLRCEDSEDGIINCRQQAYDTFKKLTSNKFLTLNPSLKIDTHITTTTMYDVNFQKILSTIFLRPWDSDETVQEWVQTFKKIHKKLRNSKPKQRTLNTFIQPKLKNGV